MRLRFLVLAVAFAPALLAETSAVGRVSGRVVDPAAHRPVEYAAIALKNAAGQIVERTATDAKGDFALENVPPGQYRVTYSLVGGDLQDSNAFVIDGQHRAADLGALEVGSDAVQLQRVEVTGRREAFFNSIDRKTYNVGKDLKSVSGTASELLQAIPSVQVDVEGNVSLRGNSSVLILVDGKPSTLMSAVNRPDVLAQMPADSIERIEVITNPSAKYKPDGTAGIINLVMKKQHAAGTSGTLRVSVGNESRSNYGLSLSYNPGNYNLFGTVSVRQDDRNRYGTETRSHLDSATNAIITTDQNTFEHMRPLSRLVVLGFDYRLGKHDKVGASASYNFRTFFRNGTVSNQTRAAAGALTADYDRLRADDEWQKTTEVKGTYTHSFPDQGHELSVELRRERHQEQENNVYTNLYRAPAAPTSRDATLIKPTETGTELTADYSQPFANEAKLEAGFSGEANTNDMDFRGSLFDPAIAAWTIDATRTNRFIYRDTIHALYATYGRPIGKFGFLAGLRVEEAVVDTNQVTAHLTDKIEYWRLHPTLHLSYNLTETGQLQLNYSHRVHRPESDDLNPFPEYQDPFNLRAGNPRLRPEETHSIEAGYQYHRDETTYLGAIYYRDTYHAFTTVTRYVDAVTLLTTHENLATNRSGGLELAATTGLGPNLGLNFSANAFYSEIDASNLGYSNRRSTIAWDVKLNLDWRATKNDTLQIDTNYSAKRLTAQGYRLPTGLMNLGWRHDFKNHPYAFTLTIFDLFDSHRKHTVIDTPTLHDDITRRRSARIFYAGFIYNFGQPAKRKNDDMQFDTGP